MTSNNAQFGCNSFTDPASIVNGLPVNADTINTRLEALYQNDLYLKQVLDYFEMPSGLIRCVEVDPASQKGQPVYYSDVSGRYELAYYSETGGSLDTNAQVWGIIVKKESNDKALILIDGIYPVDLTAAIGTPNYSGKLFLGDTPGELTGTPAGETPVFVLSASGDGSVLFRPWTGEHLGTIAQWKHSLVCEAAGTGSITDCVGSIASANDALPGWLPADDASFGGTAPAGAAFGYNIAADFSLESRWPLKYPNSAHLDFDRGCHLAIGGTSVPMGADGLAIIDENGIWWMNDCAQDLPWDPNPGTPSNDSCPRTLAKRLTLHMAAPAGGGNSAEGGSAVSLVSTHPAFRFVKENTDTLASVGALNLTFSAANLIGTNTDYSGLALKSVNGNVIDRGPVVTSIKAGNGISISSDSAYESNGDRYFHEVELSAELAGQRELLPGTTALNKATEERTLGTLGIGLPARRLSSLTSMFVVPADLTGPVTLSFRTWTMANFASGSGTGSAETLNVTLKTLEPPAPTTNATLIVEETLTLPACAIANSVVEEQVSSTFQATPGSVLYITVERESASVDYIIEVLKHYVYVESTNDGGSGVVPTTTTASPTACGCFTDCDCE